MEASTTSALEHARRHHAARAWALAFDAFQAADREQELDADDLQRFATAAYLVGRDDDYLALLALAGFDVEQCDDLSSGWRDILVARLQMYRSLRDTTVERFGQVHFDRWDRMYSAFVALYVAGKLGGVRIIAAAR